MAFVARVNRSDGTERLKIFADAEAAEHYWTSLVQKASDAASREQVTVVLKMYELALLEVPGDDLKAAREALAAGQGTETKWVRIRPPKSLRAKVRAEGPGLVDAAALERAQKTADAKAGDYLNWVLEDLAGIDASLRELTAAVQSGSPEAGSIRDRLYRQCYRVRGQGGTFGYGLVTDLGARLCHLIENVERPDARTVDAFRVHLDAMRLVIGQRLAGDGGALGTKLLESLGGVQDKVLGRDR